MQLLLSRKKDDEDMHLLATSARTRSIRLLAKKEKERSQGLAGSLVELVSSGFREGKG